MSIKSQGHSLILVKGHSDFKVKCLTFGLYTQVSDSGPQGPLVIIYKYIYLKLVVICTQTLTHFVPTVRHSHTANRYWLIIALTKKFHATSETMGETLFIRTVKCLNAVIPTGTYNQFSI